jgi:hypothetical protein
MRDQSFNKVTLSRMLRKADFRDDSRIQNETILEQVLDEAVASAGSTFRGRNPLTSIPSKSKTLYQIKDTADKLVVRKLRSNIHQVTPLARQDRNFVISNLIHLISEGVPYKLYRLDIRSFYESFEIKRVLEQVARVVGLSPLSKKLLVGLFGFYEKAGGRGMPRGMTLSATLSELMMKEFDSTVASQDGVYFYYRYVDDIIIITNSLENERSFLTWIKRKLPKNLQLNEEKKHICKANVLPTLAGAKHKIFEFVYLGYRFSVFEPAKVVNQKKNSMFRDVTVDIAPVKLAKIKTRVVKALLSFVANGDFPLLVQRIKYLTSNISVKDLDRNTHKLAGIYYNYPHVTTSTAAGLAELDGFLRIAITSNTGRVFSRTGSLLSKQQKRQLLKFSFSRGHQRRIFSYFPPVQIPKLLECWSHGK